jgi:hypothetical protein
MGQTRVDLLHLLEDLRDAYPGAIEETILTEIVANSLDSGARQVSLFADPAERTLVAMDDGAGMARRELARYHDVAASGKTRGEGIGFAGVGIKLGLLVAEEVVTETRREAVHAATRWHLASRHKAPWKWIPPPGWLSHRGTAVGLQLRNALSPLLDGGYVEATLRRHFEPLLDAAFDEVLGEHYAGGVAFVVNGRVLEKAPRSDGRAFVQVRLPRKRKPSAFGYLERSAAPLPEDRRGLAVSTLGKVIRRGWDWIGLTPTIPDQVGGLVEVPGLSAALTLNKGDFVRDGRRGITYLAYRKAIQEGVAAQLNAWGQGRDRESDARRRAARPLERDLETVLVDLAEDFPAIAALVERRAGGQRRLPVGQGGTPAAVSPAAGARLGPADTDVAAESPPDDRATSVEPSAVTGPGADSAAAPEPPSVPLQPLDASRGPRRPARYGLEIEFEERTEADGLGRLVESTVWVNAAHPAYLRAVASRSEGYHIALTVGMALAAVAVDAARAQDFLTAFLARWGAALTRDGRRRRGRPRPA